MGTDYDFNWSVAFPYHTLQDLVFEVKDKNRRWGDISVGEVVINIELYQTTLKRIFQSN
jgi:hypothetical protein